MEYVLLVTWFMPPNLNSYQVALANEPLCKSAIKALDVEAERLGNNARYQETTVSPGLTVVPPRPPTVSAVCIKQK
jgi:hypothetical protein